MDNALEIAVSLMFKNTYMEYCADEGHSLLTAQTLAAIAQAQQLKRIADALEDMNKYITVVVTQGD